MGANANIKEAYNKADKNGDGKLEKAETQEAIWNEIKPQVLTETKAYVDAVFAIT